MFQTEKKNALSCKDNGLPKCLLLKSPHEYPAREQRIVGKSRNITLVGGKQSFIFVLFFSTSWALIADRMAANLAWWVEFWGSILFARQRTKFEQWHGESIFFSCQSGHTNTSATQCMTGWRAAAPSLFMYACLSCSAPYSISRSCLSGRLISLNRGSQGISLLCYFTSTYAWLTKFTKVFAFQVQNTAKVRRDMRLADLQW